MRLKILSILLVVAPAVYPASLVQPAIDPDGVVNAASYVRRGFQNSGIARGSMFVITGSHLGPDTLVQSDTLPLRGSDGLAGTRVRVESAGFGTYALMVYTSARQVAAIMPSNMVEGTASVTVTYNSLTSNPVNVRVVRTQLGLFTLNQGGSSQAIAQNWRDTGMPLNTLISPATPGQTVILWGTGLGPIGCDEAAGPPRSSFLFLDSLYVGGQQAKVTYAGRSGCCIGLDQIIFEVPANVSGCYVPVAAVFGGVASNFATIAVSSTGDPCDDPLSFSSSSLAVAARNGRLAVGQISLRNQQAAGAAVGADSLSGSFSMYSLNNLLAAAAPVNPSAGSCYVTQTRVNEDPNALPHGDALNAGLQLSASGPAGLSAASVSPGVYLGNMPGGFLPDGVYGIAGGGGPDVGEFRASFVVAPPVQWLNFSDYSLSTVPSGRPLKFQWTGGDANSFVSIRLESTDGNYQSAVRCNARASVGSFTIPDMVTRAMVNGQGSISVGGFAPLSRFTAPGLDAGLITATSETVMSVNFARPPE